MSIEINEYYKNQYLTCGNTYDNFVFCNFPRELVSCVEKSLSQNANECTSVVLRFDKQIEEGLSKTLDACADDFQRGVLARTYYIARFMRELLHKTNQTYRHHTVEGLDAGIESLLCGDFEGSKKFYLQAPYFSEIDNFIRKNGRFELDILLDDTSNVYLQRAINCSLASRTPYSIKVFNTRDRLISSYTENGQLVEATHDYLARDFGEFIVQKDETTM